LKLKNQRRQEFVVGGWVPGEGGPLLRTLNPFDGGELPKDTRLVEPRLVCEVGFAEWTSRSGQLRHPSFKRLREDKAASDVVRDT
jgi:bifunctional non-homologous end joining protein LigD